MLIGARDNRCRVLKEEKPGQPLSQTCASCPVGRKTDEAATFAEVTFVLSEPYVCVWVPRVIIAPRLREYLRNRPRRFSSCDHPHSRNPLTGIAFHSTGLKNFKQKEEE